MEGTNKGMLALDFSGNILSSEGSLKDSKIGSTILRMLEESNNLLNNEKATNFRRLTVSFKDYEYLITVDRARVVIYLEDREAPESS